MGLFGSSKKKDEVKKDSGDAASPEPTTTAPSVTVSDKKEPLLAPQAVPNPPSGDMESVHDDPVKPEQQQEGVDYYQMMDEAMKKSKAAAAGWCGLGALSPAMKCALAGAAVTAIVLFTLLHAANSKNKSVAIIGNSYFFVNDLPRLMETISDGHIYQDSCLHGSGSLLNILKTGNGMYYRWNTNAAIVSDADFTNSNGELATIYDYGACSVPQLLLGQDRMLSENNQLGTFLSDGNNPCLQDSDYLEWQQSFNYSGSWDYVVLADQSKRMSFEESRKDALMAINYTYAPILKMIKAKPVIVQTHAWWSQDANMTGLDDVPTFTSKVMEGSKVYKQYFKEHGVRGGKVAPVGDAFLAVWEEDYDLWEQLFLGDFVHPSPKGSYLYACVLYGTIYGSMPKKGVAISGDIEGELFGNARKLQTDYEYLYPTEDEAKYLWKVAKKVALRGFKPKAYKSIGKVVVQEEEKEDYSYDADEDLDEDYQYEYQYGQNDEEENEEQDDYQYQYQYAQNQDNNQ